jgi:hypothetical protein
MSKRGVIPQREARALRKRVAELEGVIRMERGTWATDWPGGVYIGTVNWDNETTTGAAVHTARRLGHAVVAVSDGSRRFNLYALPHKAVPV